MSFWRSLALAAALVAPLVAGPFWMTLITQIYIYGLLALSVDLLLGHAGLYSLCQASFFAVAAYTTAILQVRYGYPTLVAAPAGLIAGTLLAVALRLRRAHARRLFHPHHDRARLHHLGRGVPLGVVHRRRQRHHQRAAALGRAASASPRRPRTIISCSAVVILCAFGYRILIRSPFGLSLRGIKGSESRMRSLGYRTTLHLYAAFVISGAIASLAGVLYVYYNRFINPVAASFQISVEVSLMAIVGGFRHHRRPVHRRGHLPRPAQLGQQLLRAAHRGDGRRVHRDRAVGAERHRGLHRPLARRRRQAEGPAMTAAVAHRQPRQGVRRPARRRRGLAQVAAGERRALIGPNGAGKTTLFHCVTGTLQALVRLGATVRPRRHLSAGVPAHQARHGSHVPDHQRVHRSVARREPRARHHRHRPAQMGLQPAARRVSSHSRAGARGAGGGRPRGTAPTSR